MSVLSKDFTKIITTQLLEYTTYQGSTTTVLKSTEVTVAGGVEGAIPIITVYPEDTYTYTLRGIRPCNSAEVAALKQYLFGGIAEPGASTSLYQLLYQDHGKPLRILPGGDYIAAWYSSLGVGFHYFVGYDATDYPTQIISSSSIQKVY